MKKIAINESDICFLKNYDLLDIDMNKAVRFIFDQGEYLFYEGDPIDYIYFIVSGKARMYQNAPNGRRLLSYYYSVNEIIGDIELMTGRRTAFTSIQAISEMVCIALSLDIYSTELRKDLSFVNFIGAGLAGKLIKSAEYSAEIILQPLEVRLCAYIQQATNNDVFRETLTDVAGVLGSDYRHLLRRLNILCKDKILQKETGGYRILDHHGLIKKSGK